MQSEKLSDMQTELFTEKQKHIISMLKHGELKRLNILYGSVRSGKTWITLVVFALWVATMPKNAIYLMCAKTLTSLKRNCLDLLQSIIGEDNFQYSLSAKQGNLFGRKIVLEGANDARSETKIRGMTLAGAYVDEITLVEEDFFTMLLSRLSMPNAKLFGSTNPDSPHHWLKTKYLDREGEIDIYVEKYTIDDNTFLDRDYVENIKSEYTGVFYNRFILGEFVIAEGLVYSMFDESKHVVKEHLKGSNIQYIVSIDYGTVNPFSAGLYSFDGRKAQREAEYYYDSRATNVRRDDETHYKEVCKLIGDRKIEFIIVDPSAASFIEVIKKYAQYIALPANNDVLDGIRVTTTFLNKGILKIHEDCENALNEFGLYSWDVESTEDAVVKEYDHAMDEIRYFCYTFLRQRLRWRY